MRGNDGTEPNWATDAGGVVLASGSSMSGDGTRFNHLQYPTDVVCLVALWRVRYKLSLRDLPEMFLERGLIFTHEAVREWEAQLALLYSPCPLHGQSTGRLTSWARTGLRGM